MSQLSYSELDSDSDYETEEQGEDEEDDEDNEEVDRQEIIDLISNGIQYSIEHEEELDENVIELIRILSYQYRVEQ